jgi:hypothetical protein
MGDVTKDETRKLDEDAIAFLDAQITAAEWNYRAKIKAAHESHENRLEDAYTEMYNRTVPLLRQRQALLKRIADATPPSAPIFIPSKPGGQL